MNRQIRRLGAFLLVLFLTLFAQVNYLQVFAANKLSNNPGNLRRLLIQEYKVKRGDILARDDKTVLATSKPRPRDQFKYLRVYPHGSLYAGVTGFYSIVSGRTGLEQAFNDELSGRAADLLPQRFVDEIRGIDRRGASLLTTIDARLQQVAAEALGTRRGAVVAMDPRTGEVLVMVSNPSFDPNRLATHDVRAAKAAYQALHPGRDNSALHPAATDQLFPPGSTFKVITASAALENGIGPDTLFDNPPALDLPQTDQDLHNFGGEHCLGGAAQITLAQALQISCNVVFGEVGLRLGADALVTEAERYGFNGQIPMPLRFAEGQLPPDSVRKNPPALAKSAIGQQDVRANPMQMALVVSAIANRGVMMEPRFVNEIRDSSGRIVQSFSSKVYGHPLSPANAAILTQMMISVVQAGTGTAAQIPGISVAGKTGTAQQDPGEPPHAWFVSFAPAESPQIAVAVVVLDGGDLGSEATGGAVAAPIARAVMAAALGVQ